MGSETDEISISNEVSILKGLRHVNIIRLYDVFTEPSKHYLVMERLYGGDLLDRILSKRKYTEEAARQTCKNILEAVQFCHQNKIAHRDLKPDNLLLLSKK